MLVTRMRLIYQDNTHNDLIALALIATSGKRIISRHPPDERAQNDEAPPAEELVNPNKRHNLQKKGRGKSVGLVVGDAIPFGGSLERLFAASIVIVLGVTLAQHWDPRGLYLGMILFVLIRPMAVFFVTQGNRIPHSRCFLLGWLGIRGIGSINYITYVYLRGMKDTASADMINMALTLVISSVVLHGITVAPILNSSKFKNIE